MNPDENEKYKIEFSGMPINFELKKNNYFNALAKTKPMKMGYSKVFIYIYIYLFMYRLQS